MTPPEPQTTRRQRYVLWLLLAVYTCNFVDRQIVNILAEPIKRDIGITDTQIGLLTGFAFAFLYTVLGIPLARYADSPKSDRVGIISIALFIWSGATALCGMAQNFAQLVAARVGVGIGEAGCSPAAISLIADTVPEKKRASALAFYGLGVPIGSLLGLVIGGALVDKFGWRIAFMVVGLPGVALSLLVLLTMKDPRKRKGTIASQQPAAGPTLKAALAEFARSPAFILLAIGASILTFLSYGKGVWTTIYFIREFKLSPGEAGLWLGLGTGITGIFGTWLGGALAERYGNKNPRHIMTGPAIGIVAALPVFLIGYMQENWISAMILLTLPAALSGMYFGPLFTAAHLIVRPQSRAMAVAVISFCQNFIGLGLGPLAFGALSDTLTPHYGQGSIRIVLIGSSFFAVIAAILFWMASKHLVRELQARRSTATPVSQDNATVTAG